MKAFSIVSTLALTLSLAFAAHAQSRDAVEADAESFDAAAFTCVQNGDAGGDDGTAERAVTGCYCGDGIYLGVHCDGFPSVDVCCATKCEELRNILASQE